MNFPELAARIFREKLQLEQKETLASLFEEPKPKAEAAPGLTAPKPEPTRGFYVGEKPAQLLIDEHLQIEADAVIHDGLLGSLGLVHVLVEGVDAKQQISRLLDEAIFLRHLLIEQAGTTRQIAPYFVEVVFLVPASLAKDGLDAFSAALRELVDASTVINAIGVNLWRGDAVASAALSDESLEQPHVLRRAFSWLLRDVAEWLGPPRPNDLPNPAGAEADGIESLELRNFRVAGRRTFQFPRSRSLHVVHGYNGSGKTATAEALEFALTGTVNRVQPLDGQATPQQQSSHLIDVLRHQGSKGKPKITIKCRSGSGNRLRTRSVTVGDPQRTAENGEPRMLAHAGAFRLNQALADQLMFLGPVSAATTILEAFYPAERARIQMAYAARREVEQTALALPSTLRARFYTEAKLDVAKVQSALAWLSQPSISWETLRDYLPATTEQVRALDGLLGSSFTTVYTSALTVPFEKMQQHLASAIDPDFQKLMRNLAKWNKLATQASELLENLRTLTLEAETDQRPLSQLLTQWLDRAALYDLADREHALLKTIGDVPGYSQHWRLPLLSRLDPISLSRGLPRDRAVSDLLRSGRSREIVLSGLRQERDRARTAYQARQASTETPRTQNGDAPRAVEHDLAILDEAAQLGLFGAAFRDTDWLLSEAVRQTQRDGTVTEVVASGDVVLRIGAAHWTEALRNPLRPVADTLQAIVAQGGTDPEEWASPSSLLLVLQKIAEAVSKLEVAEKGVVDIVNDIFSPTNRLLAPLNELIALLTPQRWTYQDLVLRPSPNENEQRFDPHTGGTSARLILNTAEQNAFALALFLLCARRQPNELKLIVLDDPFQNMDEFTVTGVARGLARLLRLWSQHERQRGESPWQILILIHSIENLDRLRSETSCSIMTLPWSKPLACETDGVTIQTEPLADFQGLQKLSSLITSG